MGKIIVAFVALVLLLHACRKEPSERQRAATEYANEVTRIDAANRAQACAAGVAEACK